MLELMPSLGTWRPAVSGQRCAVATIVAAGGSVPRPLGTSMLVSEHGDILGSLSGGCVEGAVVEAALQAMHDGGSRLESFGYSAEDAFAVGLSCGGELEVHIQPIQPSGAGGLDLTWLNSASGGRSTSLALIRRLDAAGGAVVVHDPARFSAAGSQELSTLLGGDDAVIRAAAAQLEPLLHGGRTGLVRLAPAEGCGSSGPEAEPISLFVESRSPAARMLIFGANDFGAALLSAGKLLGYEVTLCDARPAFSNQGRFLAADHLVTDWPHRYLGAEAAAGRIDSRTVVCVLTHDPKFDIPLLQTALDLDLAYVGAMGSRRSHRQRIDGLLDCGVPAEALECLHSPIGLDLGAVTPAEVAVSITAEILASRRPASTVGPLKDGTGPIHQTNTPEHSKVTPWT
ncbi:XdhC family protein [Arthrobacter bambusae]|uniref:XdhC family protein n=1 Tax=Arthrobacter bambusae TaxID=1338426 RepID=UPI002783D67E|nr:XdhC/CoxI family protein [Arthrobacter bambusae]MDQ0031819.1 xanthine dehydrogenase accessory factor [Arthrobacter bambusae]MDQ0099903.1 xanthine dehydrogenase accessory factor [Arthrobacter bambusae]